MKSGFSRNNLKISRVSSNVWQGTVAAQTNEQCLSNMQDTLGAGSSSDKEFCVKVLSRSCFQAQACELLPSILHKIQDSIRFKRRHHVSVCAAQLSHWQGTVAAQTNEQLRERILFEKPGSSVTPISSHHCRTKNHSLPKPSQTTPNSIVPNLGMTGPTNTNTAKIRRNHPKQKPSETLKPCNDCQSWGVGKLLEHLRVWLVWWRRSSRTHLQRRKWLIHVRFEDTSWSSRHGSRTKVKIVSSA